MGFFRMFGERLCDEGERTAIRVPSGSKGIPSETWKQGSPGTIAFLLRLDGLDPSASITEVVSRMEPPHLPAGVLNNLSPAIQQAYAEVEAVINSPRYGGRRNIPDVVE